MIASVHGDTANHKIKIHSHVLYDENYNRRQQQTVFVMNCLNANMTLIIQNIKEKNLTNNTLVLGFCLVQISKFENHQSYIHVCSLNFFWKSLGKITYDKTYQNNLHVNSIHEHPSKSFINKICIIETIRYVYMHLYVCKGFQSF